MHASLQFFSRSDFLLYRKAISYKVKNRLYINIETKLFRGSTLSKALLLSLNTRNVCYSFLDGVFGVSRDIVAIDFTHEATPPAAPGAADAANTPNIGVTASVTA